MLDPILRGRANNDVRLLRDLVITFGKGACALGSDNRITEIDQKRHVEAMDSCRRLVSTAGAPLKFQRIFEFLAKFGTDDIRHRLAGDKSRNCPSTRKS